MDREMKTEDEVLKFWKEKDIYRKVKKSNAKGKKFYMMDGPPYATGHIHMGTALNKILKDVAIRSQILQGKDVFDKPGYDTHGLPIEYQVEKEIGSKSKKDIEEYGVGKFIQKCKDFATRYIGVMDKEFANLGVWMDWGNEYKTLDKDYVETIWDVLKKAYDKKLLYLGNYSVHVCPRCATAVAFNEIEYVKQTDNAVYVKFPLKNKKNSFLLIWTTTPWTLPANVGVMVHPDIVYSEIETSHGERWIIAKDLVEKRMNEFGVSYRVIKEMKGKDMEGWKYDNPLEKHIKVKLKNERRIVLAPRYVTTVDGTGLVHCAPGHGKEDYEVGVENGLEIISPVEIDGTLNEQTGKYQGKKARMVDKEIIEDLKKDGFLAYEHRYVHDYPLCWRCKTPLLMIARPQWFLRITKIKDKLLKRNDEVNWFPSWAQSRMKAWLEGISDWPISRNRYWGTPLPIWVCEKCDEKKVIGSIGELEKFSKQKIKEVHKPEIDEINWKCKCGGEMKRIPEVLDVWFDSGVSSWAALGYPKNKRLFEKFWPADLNIEGKDQFRGWWNSQLILSEIRFGKKPYKNIMVHGMILDMGKVKMSKSLGNIISPEDVISKYGRDMTRYYFTKISKGEDFAFNDKEFNDIQRFFRVLINVNNYLNTLEKSKGKQKLKLEDKWIQSRFNSFLEEVEKSYNKYKFPEVIQKTEDFLINDLSKTYIHIIREREDEVFEILNEIRNKLLMVLSPVIPFVTEKIWQELKESKIVKGNSVHLCDWPKFDKKKIDKKIENEFGIVFDIIEKGLAERDAAKIGLRWPLAKLTINTNSKFEKDIENIIKTQLNVKKIEIKNAKELSLLLDTQITKELEAEGYARELSRKIQDFRKKLGLEKKDIIELFIFTDGELKKKLEGQKTSIIERTNAKKLEIYSNVATGKETFKNKTGFEIKDKKGEIAIVKIITKR